MRNDVINNLQEITYLNKRSIVEPVAVLLPIKKDSLASKLSTSNIQPLMLHNTKNPSIAMSPPAETMDSNLKKIIVLETKDLKENEITE